MTELTPCPGCRGLSNLLDHARRQSEMYQAQLYHAWSTIRQQQKGMQRMARRIKRLRAVRQEPRAIPADQAGVHE